MRRLWRETLARWLGAGFLLIPGGGLIGGYVTRLRDVRIDPSRSPGTPAETVIALMVVAVVAGSLFGAWLAARGRLTRAVGVALWMALMCVAGVMAWTLTRS